MKKITFQENCFYYQKNGGQFFIGNWNEIEKLIEIFSPETTTYQEVLEEMVAKTEIKELFSEKAYFTLISIIADYLADELADDE